MMMRRPKRASGKPARPISRFGTDVRSAPLLRLHPGHHLPLRGVQLPLPPLARFFEVLMSSQIGENSCLLALLLEPAKGTLEGFTFLYPDAGHPMNRLLTLVWGSLQSSITALVGSIRLTLIKIPRMGADVNMNLIHITVTSF